MIQKRINDIKRFDDIKGKQDPNYKPIINELWLFNLNQSTFIPQGAVHRLSNPGVIPLEIIEIQSGSYFGEDDIERFDDSYGRHTQWIQRKFMSRGIVEWLVRQLFGASKKSMKTI